MPLIQYVGGRGRTACSTEQVSKGTEKYCLPQNNNNYNNNNNKTNSIGCPCGHAVDLTCLWVSETVTNKT